MTTWGQKYDMAKRAQLEKPSVLKHGYYGTRTYKSWQAMKSRCTDLKRHNAASYALKGISYAPAWESFSTFLADMGERPLGMTLDRIDNSKGYYKDNCRWATPEQQRANRKDHAPWGGGAKVQKSMQEALDQFLASR